MIKMTIVEFLPILLYVLGAVLLVVLIILGVKLIITMNKIEEVVDDINKKVKTLDGFFAVVDFATDKIAVISDKVVDAVSSVIKKIFVRKGEEKENE